MRPIDADSLIESLLDCPDDEEIGLKNAREAGIKENDDTVIIDFWRRCKQSFANFVNSEPTVTRIKHRHRITPVKHGHWIFKSFPADWVGQLYICSECNEISDSQSRYCPHCGAKMNEKS